MRRSLIITGDDADRMMGTVRAVAAEFEVDIVEEPVHSDDPLQDLVFFADRLATHSGRIDRKLSKLTSIESKLSRISLSLESLVIVQRERLAFEQKQAEERALNVRK